MATYNKDISRPDDARCDAHSQFDDEGFPLPSGERSWVSLWGGPCTQCGQRC